MCVYQGGLAQVPVRRLESVPLLILRLDQAVEPVAVAVRHGNDGVTRVLFIRRPPVVVAHVRGLPGLPPRVALVRVPPESLVVVVGAEETVVLEELEVEPLAVPGGGNVGKWVGVVCVAGCCVCACVCTCVWHMYM